MKWFESIAKVFRGGEDTRESDRTQAETMDATVAGDTAGFSHGPQVAQAGDLVGPYRIVRLVAEGGMGQVYLADRDGHAYAVKTITPAPGQDQNQLLERFRREIAVGEAIHHDNVCRLLDAGATGARHYLAMEFLEGKTLAEYIESSAPLPTDWTRSVLHQVLCGVEAIHAADVVHRDLKPANVMVLDTGIVKIMDLGISQSTLGPSLTKTGAALGTPQFIAPEQVEDAKRVDNRVDLFCVGLIGYQMLSGKLPYDAPRMTLRMHRLVRGDQTSLAEHRPDLEPPMQDWIAHMTRHNRDERFATATEARLALEAT